MKKEMFKNMGGNILSGNFPGGVHSPGENLMGGNVLSGIFPGGVPSPGENLMGGNFLDANFPWGIFLIPYLLLESNQRK